MKRSALLLLALVSLQPAGQAYPSKPVRLLETGVKGE
jgi:hypothetical protein